MSDRVKQRIRKPSKESPSDDYLGETEKPDWLGVCNCSGEILVANPDIESIIGFDRNELVGRQLFNFVIPTSGEPPEIIFPRIIKNGWEYMDATIFHKSGRQLTRALNASYIDGLKDGIILAFLQSPTPKPHKLIPSAAAHTNESLRQERILKTAKNLILPIIDKLKLTDLSPHQRTLVTMLERNMLEILSAVATDMVLADAGLTPMEIQIADLVKRGNASKEIARMLNLSPRTIESYRDGIRKKLGIKHAKINLQKFLMETR